MARFLLLAAATLVAACGNSDNQVFGGVGATTDTPSAIIPNVNSAISAVVPIPDAQGNKTNYDVVVLADSSNLCRTLAGKPDYFKTASEAFTALILITPADTLGTFQIGASNGAFVRLEVTPGAGSPVTAYSGTAGLVSLREFGGTSSGTFDLIMANCCRMFGKFKASACPALANAGF